VWLFWVECLGVGGSFGTGEMVVDLVVRVEVVRKRKKNRKVS
jgi:hypothetical protein